MLPDSLLYIASVESIDSPWGISFCLTVDLAIITPMYSYTRGFEKLLQHTDEKRVFEIKIGEYISRYGARSLLDIGAGDGSLATLLAKKVVKYVAVEPKGKYVSQLQAAGLETVQGTFPIPIHGIYDLVLMSHVISYNHGNQGTLIPAAWKLVKSGGHLLVVTHGNNQDDDWEKLLTHIGFGESEKFVITSDDIVEAMTAFGSVELQKVETVLEARSASDLIEALNFIASGSDAIRSEKFMKKSDMIEQYLTDNYYKRGKFSFPFQHLFVSLKRD